ncbi:MAG TPA: hypothetical protein VIS96_10440 [Terrimicrobiaceae bacterium]
MKREPTAEERGKILSAIAAGDRIGATSMYISITECGLTEEFIKARTTELQAENPEKFAQKQQKSGDPNGFEPECMIASFSRIVGDTLTSEVSVIGPSEVTKGNKVFAETALDCNFDTNKSVASGGFIHGVSEATLPFKQVG